MYALFVIAVSTSIAANVQHTASWRYCIETIKLYTNGFLQRITACRSDNKVVYRDCPFNADPLFFGAIWPNGLRETVSLEYNFILFRVEYPGLAANPLGVRC
jgi:hypothetical protein